MTGEPGDRSLDPALEQSAGAAAPNHDTPPSRNVPASSSSGSGDEFYRRLEGSAGELAPDPYLDQMSSGDPDAVPVVAAQEPPPSESFDAVVPVAAPIQAAPADRTIEGSGQEPPAAPNLADAESPPGFLLGSDDGVLGSIAETAPPPASSGDFPAIDLSAPPSARTAEAPEEDDAEDDHAPDRPRSWLNLLLFSYASAVTLGLMWVLFSGRKLRETEGVEAAPAVDTRPDPGVRADRSRRVEPRVPLEADRVTTIGKPLRVGSLEVRPLAIGSGPVELRRNVAGHEHRDGGSGALRLALRLKNVSADTIFAPLDEAYVRDREPGMPDSLIETGQGELGMYPLAVASEWSIVGQEFRELRPGESFETVVVSASDAADQLTSGMMTWRIRLRTGINQTDTIGVRFGKEDVRAD